MAPHRTFSENLRERWGSAFREAGALLFPELCCCCGVYLLHHYAGGYPLCAECRNAVVGELIRSPRCRMCGRPLLGEEELCTSCRERHFRISSITPLGMYRGALARVLQAYKLRHHRLLARFFAELLAPRFAEWDADCIVTCVPSRPASLRKRGWDHTGEIMRILSARYGVRAVPLLTRRAGRAQKELDFQARMQNLQGKIALVRTPRPHLRLEGREVLCFDDVLTTGASLEACAAELLSAGVKSVRAIVIAADP